MHVTASGAETLSNKSFSGPLNIHTNGSRVGITSADAPLEIVRALVHIYNDNAVTCGLLTTSVWHGSAESQYQNNDTSLWEVLNDISSDSSNRSWAGSFANAYNNIPLGVEDNGDRTGVIGWAVSVNRPGYNHAGTLRRQIGVQGTAGFQGAGSAPTAVIEHATGILGVIYNGSQGATIENARAAEFISTASTGRVKSSVAVYAQAANGERANFSFYGQQGNFFNKDAMLVGSHASQSSSKLAARHAGNSFEFGHPDLAGYGSNIGASYSSGAPFIALCAEADPAGNTFETRGKKGVVINTDMAGSLVFSRLSEPDAAEQDLTESARFDADGHLVLAETPRLPSKVPTSPSAVGRPGEMSWDDNYVYVCVADNVWKRSALSTWDVLATED